MENSIRCQDRVLNDEARISSLLQESQFGYLSLGIDEQGYAYSVPGYVYDEESNSLYFHCALDGKKINLLENNNKVSFCVIGNTQPIPEKFTTIYESVIVFGSVELHLSDAEKQNIFKTYN